MNKQKATNRQVIIVLGLIGASLLGYQIESNINREVAINTEIIACEENSTRKEIEIDLSCNDAKSELTVSNKTNKPQKIKYETQQTNAFANKKGEEVVLSEKEEKVIQLPGDTEEVNVNIQTEDEETE